MKNIRLVLDEEEYQELKKKKGNMTWREYLKRDDLKCLP